MRQNQTRPGTGASSGTEAQVNVHESTDALLTAAAQSGNSAAFVELSRRHSKRIKCHLFRILRNWEDAEDVLQDSLLKAFTHIGQFRKECTFSTWLTGIAINSALMVLRTKKGHTMISIDHTTDSTDGEKVWELPDHSSDPEFLCADREIEELLQGAIGALPCCFRSVIELYHTGDYSANEVAKTLGISVPAVKSRLMRARMALRTSLADLGRPVSAS